MRAAVADKEDGVKELCTVVFLAMNSWLDIRRREISLFLTVVYAGCGIIYSILQGRKIQDVLIPAGIGILFLAAGLISRGAIGAGDCWILLALGALLDTETYIRDALHWIFSGSVLVRDFACDPQEKQEDRDSAGAFSAGGIYRRNFDMTDLRQIKKGSFTIEAACVMSLVLLVLMGVLYLSFFVHNRAWLTAAACESALTGSMEGVRKDGQPQEAASVRSRELGNVGFFGAENLTGQVNGGKEIKVTYTADTVSGFGGLKWKLAVDGSSRVVRPVEWIRKIRAASEVIAEIGG